MPVMSIVHWEPILKIQNVRIVFVQTVGNGIGSIISFFAIGLAIISRTATYHSGRRCQFGVAFQLVRYQNGFRDR